MFGQANDSWLSSAPWLLSFYVMNVYEGCNVILVWFYNH